MQNHHPSIETLTDYASGVLKLSHALGIATHIEYCSECKASVKKLEHIGAELFSRQVPVTTPIDNTEELKSAVFDRIFADAPAEEKIQVKPTVIVSHSKAVPKSLSQFIDTSFDQLNWKRISPSIKVATLCNDKDGTQIALSCVKAGGKMPHHTHTGQEITVVLEGSFSDEDGIYSKGDFMLRDANDKHTPVVSKDSQCICLMVLDSPIEFTGLFSRLLNPIVKRSHYAG